MLTQLDAIPEEYLRYVDAHSVRLDVERQKKGIVGRAQKQKAKRERELAEIDRLDDEPTDVAVSRKRKSRRSVDALARYDDNGNGRITCSEARNHGIATIPRSHPAYHYMRDGDGDGVVCE